VGGGGDLGGKEIEGYIISAPGRRQIGLVGRGGGAFRNVTALVQIDFGRGPIRAKNGGEPKTGWEGGGGDGWEGGLKRKGKRSHFLWFANEVCEYLPKPIRGQR